MTINKFITKKYLISSALQENPTSSFYPKMASYLLNKEKGPFILDLVKISKFLKLAGNILQKQAEKGCKFLFVATDKDLSLLLKKEANITKNFYVNSRWLGGMFTNWQIFQRKIIKLSFLEDSIDKKTFKFVTKKEIAIKKKEIQKFNRLFIGIKKLKFFPQVVVFIDEIKNLPAIKECLKAGIPTIVILHNDNDSKFIPYPIIFKKNLIRPIIFLLRYLNTRIAKGYDSKELKKYKGVL